jgi:hypothetical protein
MAEEGLKIKIGADVQQAVTSLNTLNASLNNTTQTAANVGTAGMNQLTKGTNQANVALVNFSRVASDAPFGLIGIANNIDPLVQSFVSLRKETGSGKAALAALGASLTGGGGLILGISLVTSALQFAQIGFDRWFKSTKDTKKETESLSDTLENVTNSISKEVTQVTKLVELIKSENSSRKLKNEAIQELIKTAPAYFDNLNKENISINDLNESYKRYINTIQLRIRASVIEKQLGDIISAEQEINTLRSQRGNDPFGLKSLLGANSLNKLNTVQLKTQSQENAKLLNLGSKRNILLNDLIKLQQQIGTLDLTNTNNQSKANKQAKKDIFDLTDALKKYSEQLKGINWDEQNRQIDGTKKRLELAGETLKTLYLAGVKETSSAWIKVKSDFDKFQSDYDKFLRDERLKEINEGVKELRTNIGSFSEKELTKGQENTIKGLQKVGAAFLANYELQQKGLKDLQKKNQELANTISGFLSPALEGVFESLVKGEDPFEALKNSVKQLIIELGKAVIKSLILKAVTSAIGGPAGAAAGQAIGLSTIRGDSFSFLLNRGS